MIDVDDATFDHMLPTKWRGKSAFHFTPMKVARRAARLLAPEPGMRVLDVGAGVGKFCLAAAAEVPAATFVGIEHRKSLVHVAENLAKRCRLANVTFLHGDAFAHDWSSYDALYFFNPFGEQMLKYAFVLDDTIERAPGQFENYVEATKQCLANARVGARVVTYHGFGGAPPLGYERTHVDTIGSDRLELWIKTRA